jgi:hypothetical protein
MEWSGQFTYNGLMGNVRAECVPNDDPVGYGCFAAEAHGFPVCAASVEYPRRGYQAMFGWVQLVCSTDNNSKGERFEPDPLALFGDSGSPYCWYGTEPVLWDAPSRLTREPLEWVAHSFLATTPILELLDGNPRKVVPLLGFSWGFDIADGAVTLHEIRALEASDWNRDDLPVLRADYPAPFWTFADATAFS